MNINALHRTLATLSVDEMERLATHIGASRLFKRANTMEAAFAHIAIGQSLNLTLLEALNDVIIEEKGITMKATLMASLIRRHPNYDYGVEHMDDEGSELAFYTVSDDGGKTLLGNYAFSVKNATLAGLTGKATYKAYGRDMYFSRALSGGFKKYCPDAIGAGIYAFGELDDPIATDEPVVTGRRLVPVPDVAASDKPAQPTTIGAATDQTDAAERKKISDEVRAILVQRNIPDDKYNAVISRIYPNVTVDTLELLDAATLKQLCAHARSVGRKPRSGKNEQKETPRSEQPAIQTQLDSIKRIRESRGIDDATLANHLAHLFVGKSVTLETISREQAGLLIGALQKRSA